MGDPDPVSSIAQIRRYYSVPAKRGGRVVYTGGRQPQEGVITGASHEAMHLMIRLDGETFTRPYHPTWELTYL